MKRKNMKSKVIICTSSILLVVVTMIIMSFISNQKISRLKSDHELELEKEKMKVELLNEQLKESHKNKGKEKNTTVVLNITNPNLESKISKTERSIENQVKSQLKNQNIDTDTFTSKLEIELNKLYKFLLTKFNENTK